MICYFFYKNIAFGLTLFYFEAYTGFSGQSVYEDWYMILFNVILTSLPVISLGVFEQDVSSEVCLQLCTSKDPRICSLIGQGSSGGWRTGSTHPS